MNWSIIVGTLFSGLTAIVSVIIQQWSILFVIIIPAVLFIFENYFTSQIIKKKMLTKIYPKIIDSYKKKIKENLREVEKPYEQEIVEKSIKRTDLINKCLLEMH